MKPQKPEPKYCHCVETTFVDAAGKDCKIPVPDFPGAKHDCAYVAARNRKIPAAEEKAITSAKAEIKGRSFPGIGEFRRAFEKAKDKWFSYYMAIDCRDLSTTP